MALAAPHIISVTLSASNTLRVEFSANINAVDSSYYNKYNVTIVVNGVSSTQTDSSAWGKTRYIVNFSNISSFPSSVRVDTVTWRNNILYYDIYTSSTTTTTTTTIAPTTTTTSSPVIASNICFVAGTPVNTDDGPVAIENLGSHTIRGKKSVGITRTLYSGTHLIRLDRHSIERNVPSQTTIVTPLHKIRYKHRMTCAGDIPTGVSIPYEGQLLYNVLLDHYGTMSVNGMLAETLHPNNIVARLHNTPIASRLYTAKR